MADIRLGRDSTDFTGTSGPDVVFGGAGNDSITGIKGDDVIRGGRDLDEARGGRGDDQVAGGRGDDKVVGGDGNDTVFGGDGDDKLVGRAGDDMLFGGHGVDTVVIKQSMASSTISFGKDANGKFVQVESAEGVDKIYGAEFIKFEDGTFVICFYPGTLVRTPEGEVPVETLSHGDLVVTADGRNIPVRWMGRQTVSTRFGDPMKVLPIRVRAGALGENLPVRDLLVSPAHALLVGGVLVQAGALVNGTTVTRETDVPEVFTYWHVETADHSLILAEGTPAETFVDNTDRENFDNWDEYRAFVGHAAAVPEMDLPRAKSHRQVPAAVRALLAERAAVLRGAEAAAA